MFDEPHRTAATPAREAADAMRQLTYATLPADGAPGLGYPSDVHETLTNLATLADRLPQALDQMSYWLERGVGAGHFAVPTGMFIGDPIAAVATTQAALQDARYTATLLSQHLHDAHHAVAAVVLHDHDEVLES